MRPLWPIAAAAAAVLAVVRPVYSVHVPRARAGVSPESAAATEFFEAKVRPVLAERCTSCHSGSKAAAGLDFSSRAPFLRTGPHGAAIVPGDPDRSRLIQAIRQSGALKMPPDGRLPEAQVRDLESWVRAGAPWPERVPGPTSPVSGPAGTKRDFGPGTLDLGPTWAFQPVRKPAEPAVHDRAWVKTPIDAFVLAKLEAQNLHPSPQADRRTLIRRATFDLTGLPPTPGEVEAFVRDTSPDAWAKVVDRLLASPRYGERWGRFWLDAARYADTKDYVYAGERRYPFSYAYRDYVIRSFNQDLPYDQFLVQQLAADQLPQGADKRPLAALGFLTLGRRFVNVESDIVDDRIDVVFRTTQALTVGCARCHDHKYDPIPTKDYYSLYGVFAATTDKTVQIAPDPAPSAAYHAYAEELAKRQARLDQAIVQKCEELSARLRRQAADYLVRVAAQGQQPGEGVYLVMGVEDINPLIVHKWRVYINQRGNDAVFGPWHAFERLPAKTFAAQAPAVARQIARNAEGRVDPEVAALFRGNAPASMKEVAARYGALLARAASPAVRRVLSGEDSPTFVPRLSVSDLDYYFDENSRKLLNGLQAEVDGWYIKSPVTPEHALILTDRPNPPQPHVFIRGNRANEGPEVPRRFLQVLSGPNRQPFQHGSGRLELARAIASKRNPLTARVMVNRVWLGHFGAGLVRTPSDFGARGERPTHPELLDWLSAYFVGGVGTSASGVGSKAQRPMPNAQPWSIKKLHRLIMLSSVYQQASEDRPDGLGADPQNALLWKMNRHRLEFEALRDSLLSVSGRLDTRMGGRPVDLLAEPAVPRRAVYGFVDRQNLPGLLRMFNVPSGDQHSPQRYVTTSPQQALFMMNSPFVTDCAKGLIDGAHLDRLDDPASGVRALYLRIYQREPSPSELRLGEQFLTDAGGVNWTNLPRLVSRTKPGLDPWAQYAQALLLTNEFAFVD